MSVQSIPAPSPGQGGTDRGAPCHHSRPFAAVPLDMLEDARLRPSDIMIVCVLLMHARSRSTCYPSVRTLARETRQSERWVQYGLKRLADTGWISSRPASSPDNGTGRELVLTWRVQRAAPGGVQKPYSQGLPRVQGRAPECRKNQREIEGSALARGEGMRTQTTQPAPAPYIPPSLRPPEKPPTPAEVIAHYAGGGWLNFPRGHRLREIAERRIAEALGEAGSGASPAPPSGRRPGVCAPFAGGATAGPPGASPPGAGRPSPLRR